VYWSEAIGPPQYRVVKRSSPGRSKGEKILISICHDEPLTGVFFQIHWPKVLLVCSNCSSSVQKKIWHLKTKIGSHKETCMCILSFL
jgi:hypothetical protein